MQASHASLDRSYLYKVIVLFLVYALVPVGEIILFVYLGNVIGNYLILVLAAVVGIPGALVMLGQTRRSVAALRARIAQRQPVAAELRELAATAAAALLLITPGFVTDLCGYLLLIPRMRSAVGRFIGRKLAGRSRDIVAFIGL